MSCFISYRIVYFILIGAGDIYIYIFIYMYSYRYMTTNAFYCVCTIVCMYFMLAHFMYADFMMFF